MRKDDLIRIHHMLDAAREAISFVKGRKRSDLDTNRMLVLSLVKSIEIMGEAASKVTKESREGSPEVPWLDVIGMRNRLIHVYFDIDLDRVWDTITDDLPSVIAVLEKIVQKQEKPFPVS
ncbi:MAG: DUF86 domain-containing protein [Deltaproteobacteria bacterium]|nr:DUF86 domain-containing protein [Deltaproteobacteria bacterium]MBM4323751.1 DUF86 domain-containing protein [Deltaproteobacteria bacterium]